MDSQSYHTAGIVMKIIVNLTFRLRGVWCDFYLEPFCEDSRNGRQENRSVKSVAPGAYSASGKPVTGNVESPRSPCREGSVKTMAKTPISVPAQTTISVQNDGLPESQRFDSAPPKDHAFCPPTGVSASNQRFGLRRWFGRNSGMG